MSKKTSSLSLKPARPKSKREELSSKIASFENEGEAPQAPSPEEQASSPSKEATLTTVYERADNKGQDYRSTIYFPKHIHDIMKGYCAAERVSISKFVTQLVQAHLEEIGPLEDSNSFMAAYYTSKIDD